MQQEILLLEDDDSLNHSVRLKLEREGYTVRSAFTIKEALLLFRQFSPSLIICDITLPDGSGLDFCSRVRQESDVLSLFLTALDREEDIMAGYGQGADDYITKPFLPEELILRVTAVLKRAYRVKNMQEQELISLGKCAVDLGSGVVKWNRGAEDSGEMILTAKEYAILQKLAQERGRIVTIDALCDAVWREENYGYENTLVVHIRRLREKIEEDPSHPKYLLTVRGLGYRLV